MKKEGRIEMKEKIQKKNQKRGRRKVSENAT